MTMMINSSGVPNVSVILNMLQQLSTEQLVEIYRDFGFKHHDDVVDFLLKDKNVDARSYEEVTTYSGYF